jgi:hypothetical protein
MYQLREDKIFELYKDFKSDYNIRYADRVQEAIKVPPPPSPPPPTPQNVATQFPTTDYFLNREAIRSAMQAAATSALASVHAHVRLFQFREIGIPRDIELVRPPPPFWKACPCASSAVNPNFPSNRPPRPIRPLMHQNSPPPPAPSMLTLNRSRSSRWLRASSSFSSRSRAKRPS